MGALSVTWDDHYRAPFAPLAVRTCTFVSPNDPDALIAAVDANRPAAVIVEPMQGEGGVRPFSQRDGRRDHRGVPAHRRAAHRRRSAVRPRPHRAPVLLAGARPRAGPDGASARRSAPACRSAPRSSASASRRPPAFGDHGSTYGGNLLACRAALVFLEELDRPRPDRARRAVGAHLERGLRAIAARQPIVNEVRGAGLMWGLELDRPALPVVEAALRAGLLVNRTSDTVVRLLPPYVITAEEVDEACALLEPAIGKGRGGTSISERFSRHCGPRVRRTRRPFTGSSRTTSRRATCCRGPSRTSSRTSRGSSSPPIDGDGRRLRRAGAAQRQGRRSALARRRRGDPRPPHRRRAGEPPRATATRARLLDALRVHARAVALRPLGFTIVPHIWVPEKIAHDCRRARCSAAAASTR